MTQIISLAIFNPNLLSLSSITVIILTTGNASIIRITSKLKNSDLKDKQIFKYYLIFEPVASLNKILHIPSIKSSSLSVVIIEFSVSYSDWEEYLLFSLDFWEEPCHSYLIIYINMDYWQSDGMKTRRIQPILLKLFQVDRLLKLKFTK